MDTKKILFILAVVIVLLLIMNMNPYRGYYCLLSRGGAAEGFYDKLIRDGDEYKNILKELDNDSDPENENENADEEFGMKSEDS